MKTHHSLCPHLLRVASSLENHTIPYPSMFFILCIPFVHEANSVRKPLFLRGETGTVVSPQPRPTKAPVNTTQASLSTRGERRRKRGRLWAWGAVFCIFYRSHSVREKYRTPFCRKAPLGRSHFVHGSRLPSFEQPSFAFEKEEKNQFRRKTRTDRMFHQQGRI